MIGRKGKREGGLLPALRPFLWCAVVGAVACPARWLPGIALEDSGGASPSPTAEKPGKVELFKAFSAYGTPPCLSLWERWHSASCDGEGYKEWRCLRPFRANSNTPGAGFAPGVRSGFRYALRLFWARISRAAAERVRIPRQAMSGAWSPVGGTGSLPEDSTTLAST